MQFYGKSVWLAAGMAACMASACLPAVGGGKGSRVGRGIEDPSSGRRLVLENDAAHPGGPCKRVEEPASTAGNPESAEKSRPVIHAGDRVVVEEHTRVARGLLDATALSSARQGARFRVRLQAGGRVLWAIAMGPGHAILAGADEVGQ